MKTSELTGAALDWAVAQADGLQPHTMGTAWWIRVTDPRDGSIDYCEMPQYSTDWAQCGPIIEREKIEWQWLPSSEKSHQYGARKPSLGGLNRTFCMDGPTVLVAAMRCYVASRLGDEVDVPEELK